MTDSNGKNRGRDRRGRFSPGNKAAVGHSTEMRRTADQLRRALTDGVSPEEMRRLGRALLTSGLEGDVQAARLLLSYVIGPPDLPVVVADDGRGSFRALIEESFRREDEAGAAGDASGVVDE